MSRPGDESREIRIKKDVVKNIAIVFLAIMLVLTFFSNSIMNKSLPEVAVRYVEGGSISEKVRGTGVVEADDPYSVTAKDTRTIASIPVSVGDEIEKDQVLMYLEAGESDELDKAQKELEDLIFKYTTDALTGEMSAEAYNQATSGKVSSMSTYESRIEAAKAKVKAAQDKCDSISRQQTVASSVEASSADLNQTKLELNIAETILAEKEAVYNEIKASAEKEEVTKQEANYAELEESNAKAAYESEYEKARNVIYDETIWNAVRAEMCEINKQRYSDVITPDDLRKMIFKKKIVQDGDALNDWVKAVSIVAPGEYTSEDLDALTEAYKNYVDKQTAATEAKNALAELNGAKAKLATAESEYNSAKSKVNELKTRIDQLSNNAEIDAEGNKVLQSNLAIQKADAELELEKAKEEQTQLLLDISKTLDLSNQSSNIKDQQEKVEKLREDASGATIVAPVSGTIASITKTAGERTTPDEALITIQVTGKAKTMSISVTEAQSKKVKVGDVAELQNAWYYDNVSLALTKIMPDPDDPAKKKKLLFSVDGDVAAGSSLSVAVGQAAREFDKVVPNSAIKEDNRGKFILVIEEKGTPFGTRYKAKRVDVEVLASDDNSSAIEADISSWVYVVTTSNKPVNAGAQVRLSDN